MHPNINAQAGPSDNAAFSTLMVTAALQNNSLLQYCYPAADALTADATLNWVPHTSGCEVCRKCYCFHVEGDMKKSMNPDGWKKCAGLSTIGECEAQRRQICNCFRSKMGGACLFSDMRPTKVLAAITAARLAGVKHIIEEGRFGGLTAMMYALHGFRVTSLEFLPLDGVTNGMSQLAPSVAMVTGDGSQLVPDMVANMTDAQAKHTMVVFDGEKRMGAFDTWRKVAPRVALAIFDDTNVGTDSLRFQHTVHNERWVAWNTTDPTWSQFIEREEVPLRVLKPLLNYSGKWQGGVNNLQKFHFTIVKGGGWSQDHVR